MEQEALRPPRGLGFDFEGDRLNRYQAMLSVQQHKYACTRNYRKYETYEPPRIVAPPDVFREYEIPVWMMSLHGGG